MSITQKCWSLEACSKHNMTWGGGVGEQVDHVNSFPLSPASVLPLKRRVAFSRPYICGYFLHEYGQDFSSRVAAHAPTKYQSNSTSGSGARASYRTMLPEISARRSLLEPNFRYLSPGREGEKCRPLDHT